MTTLSAQSTQVPQNIQRRVQEKVAQMNDYISLIGSKKRNLDYRQKRIQPCLNLFIGCGNAYTEYISETRTTQRDGVKMQTTSTRRKNAKPTEQLMRNYLPRLANLNYTDVQITSTSFNEIKVSNLKRISDNEWQCTAYYEQVFKGYKDGRPVYGDKTNKHIVCHVFLEETDEGSEFVIRLGDVEATDTEVIR